MQQLEKLKQNTARLSVISNTVLVILKLVVGFMTGAVSIVSEAAHSAVDLLAALIAFYAVKKSSIPPDDNHAYGHGKFENVSAAAEAMLIVLAALWIVYEAVDKIRNPHAPEMLEYGIAVMVISIAVNYIVSRRLFAVARQTGSQALEADGLHLQADIWTSIGVLIGLAVIEFTGMSWLDPVIAIAVSIFVFKAGYDMTRKSLYELTDASLPEEEEELICKILGGHPDVINHHRLRTRRSGSWRLVDVHLVLHKDMHLDKAHNICDQLEAEIKNQLGRCDVVIHLEPCDYHEGFGYCPRRMAKKEDEKKQGQ